MKHLTAIIREAECIGCTKCIQACPVDAILGATKQMHSVITDECTGCEMCIAPCPVDCIDLVEAEHVSRPAHYHHRHVAKQKRLIQEDQQIQKSYINTTQSSSIADKRNYIAEAIARVKKKIP